MGFNSRNIINKWNKPEYYDKIQNILNRYLISRIMPEEITTSRLFYLNKKGNEPCNFR